MNSSHQMNRVLTTPELKMNTTIFIGNDLKKSERSKGVSTPPLRLPPKCDNPRTGNTAPSQTQGRSGETGTVPSFILPVLCISYQRKWNYHERSTVIHQPESMTHVCFSRASKKLLHQVVPIRVMRDRTGLSDSNPNKILFP